jgi:hypothetical protein
MSESARRPLYAVDTNVFMDWQFRHYPTDIFPSLLSRIDSLVAERRFQSPELVDEELRKGAHLNWPHGRTPIPRFGCPTAMYWRRRW